ncbi:hypothetical protein ZIOFF_028400 [Zingiber officinale]|uniref:Uncharacterized protein n=1 Tax=Zingiber officinale TaxID=94328 RepID=A0A8J5H672_ZINOF|nr:hypothetical protein ZIOFF_028400 [Zingiber officinale]
MAHPPPICASYDGTAIRKELSDLRPPAATESMKALKWVRRCCQRSRCPLSGKGHLLKLNLVNADHP